MEPGDTVLTRMPCGTNSSAQRSVSKISAAFAAPYWPDMASWGDQPEIEATLMTAAPVRPCICGSASRIIRTVWIRFRSMALRQSSSVLSAMRAPPPPPPTLFIRTSIPPKAVTAAWTSPAASSGWLTSAGCTATSTPLMRRAAAAAANGSADRAARITRQPSAATALAVASPPPRPEPVINATLPASCRSIGLGLCLLCSNPRRHLVVVVGEVILGDGVGRRRPHAIVAEDVSQRLVEMFGGIGPPDIVRMQRQAHNPAVIRPFAVQGVELVLDHVQEVIGLAIPRQHAGVIGLAGIRHVDEFLAAPDIDRPGLIIDDPGGVIEAAGLGH